MIIKFIDSSEDFTQFETLRASAFGLNYGISKYYYEKFKQHNMLIIGAYVNDELVGCAYVSPFCCDNGYIDQLFVRKDYHNNELHVGTSILRYIEDNISDISDYFDLSINRLLIEYCDTKTRIIYKKHGYKPTNLDGTLYKKVNNN